MFDVELNTLTLAFVLAPNLSSRSLSYSARAERERIWSWVKSCWYTSEVRRDAKCEARVGTLDEVIDLKSNISARGGCLG